MNPELIKQAALAHTLSQYGLLEKDAIDFRSAATRAGKSMTGFFDRLANRVPTAPAVTRPMAAMPHTPPAMPHRPVPAPSAQAPMAHAKTQPAMAATTAQAPMAYAKTQPAMAATRPMAAPGGPAPTPAPEVYRQPEFKSPGFRPSAHKVQMMPDMADQADLIMLAHRTARPAAPSRMSNAQAFDLLRANKLASLRRRGQKKTAHYRFRAAA